MAEEAGENARGAADMVGNLGHQSGVVPRAGTGDLRGWANSETEAPMLTLLGDLMEWRHSPSGRRRNPCRGYNHTLTFHQLGQRLGPGPHVRAHFHDE